MIPDALRPLWTAPRPPGAPARVWRDWVLVGLLVPTAVLEALHRTDVTWRPVVPRRWPSSTVLALLWRRTHPLAVVVVVFGSLAVVDAAALVAGVGEWGLYTTVCVLLVPYALCRWGSGREIVLGLRRSSWSRWRWGSPATGRASGTPCSRSCSCSSPAAIGAWVRLRRHVAGARAGPGPAARARAARPGAARHRGAPRLRDRRPRAGGSGGGGDEPRRGASTPCGSSRPRRRGRSRRCGSWSARCATAARRSWRRSRGSADIERLARAVGGPPRVELELSGDLDDLRPAVGVAVYRLAQESITNALRHARHASRIDVRVVGDDDCVRLTVVDDGEIQARTRHGLRAGRDDRARDPARRHPRRRAGRGPRAGRSPRCCRETGAVR